MRERERERERERPGSCIVESASRRLERGPSITRFIFTTVPPSPSKRLTVHSLFPNTYLWVIAVKLDLGKRRGPQGDLCVLDAVRGRPRRLGQRAQGILGLRREHPQRAIKARRHSRQQDARVALEPLGAAVDQGLDGLHEGLALFVILEERARLFVIRCRSRSMSM